MKKIVYIAFCFGIIFQSFAQSEQTNKLFAVAMRTHFKNYAQKADYAYMLKDYHAADSLLNSFISNNLVNTQFSNFKAKKLNGRVITIDQYFKKPVVLITYASWCVRSEKKDAKLNALAKELHRQVDFVVLFWDDLRTARKSAKSFNKHITILYINERENIFSKEVTTLKQTLGYPLTLYISNDNKIVDINKKTPSYQTTSTSNTISSFQNGLSALLVNASTSETAIAKQ